MQQPDLNLPEAAEDVLATGSDETRPSGAKEEQQAAMRPPEDQSPSRFRFTPQLIRLNKDHELFEDGDIHRHMYLQDLFISGAEDKPALSVSEFGCHISGCSAVFSALDDYEHHYNSLHRHVCCSCRRSLPTARLLDIHIHEWHDPLFTILAQKEDMYLCLVEGCGQKFRTSQQRKDHLIRIHKYPPDFRFDKNRRGPRETKTHRQKDSAMEVEGDVCNIICNELPDDPEQEESMDTHAATEEEAAAAQGSKTNAAPLKPQYSHRVPSAVCFGHGSVRGFRGRRGRRK